MNIVTDRGQSTKVEETYISEKDENLFVDWAAEAGFGSILVKL